MATIKRIIANRINSKASSGPQTSTGKKRSSRNSYKTGFFARELYLPEADQIIFDELLANLEDELAPTSTLLGFALRGIVRCAWRCDLALKLETRGAESLLKQSDEKEIGATVDPKEIPGWYALRSQDLRAATSWLTEVCLDFRENHRPREEWKPHFDRLFGPGFYDSWIERITMPHDAITMAIMLHEKTKTLVGPVLGFEDYKKSHPTVIDPLQHEEHMQAQLDLQLSHMQDLRRVLQQGVSASAASPRASDFCPRYYTIASRDFRRAVDLYFHLKEMEKNLKDS